MSKAEIPADIKIVQKRARPETETRPSKRQRTELSGAVAHAKEEFARLIDVLLDSNNTEEDIDKDNEFVKADEAISKGLQDRERQLRTRDSLLCAANSSVTVPQKFLDLLKEKAPTQPPSRSSSGESAPSSVPS